MILSMIVAAAENGVIGRDNGLVWHMSSDLKHFKAITSGHTVIMGRRTFESIGRALPKRRNIVISGNSLYKAEGCEMAASLEDALNMVQHEDEVFVIGGGSIYRQAWEFADRLYLTIVHTEVQGDTFIPNVDENVWKEVNRQDFKAGEKDDFDYSFVDYVRKNKYPSI